MKTTRKKNFTTRIILLKLHYTFIVSFQISCSVVWESLQPHALKHARPPCPSPNSQSLLKLISFESVMPSNHLSLCHPLILLPSVFPSIKVFSNESALHMRWPKYCRFGFSLSPSNEYSGLISFRLDWLDLLSVHGTLKSLLQHSWKEELSTTVQKHQFFGAQLCL